MKRFFFENIGLKLSAVFLSIVLWFYVTSRGQSEIFIDLPLEFVNLPPGLELVNHSVKMVSLNIRGQQTIINSIKPSNIKVTVDMSKAKKGENIYYITRDDIKLPGGVAVTNISPSSVKVIIEETAIKSVKVIPVITGEVRKGFYIKSIDVSPPKVEIEGIRSEIRKINSLKTESLDLTGVNETITQYLKLDIAGRNIRTKINEVKVKITIDEKEK